jgi:hypothetical protein
MWDLWPHKGCQGKRIMPRGHRTPRQACWPCGGQEGPQSPRGQGSATPDSRLSSPRSSLLKRRMSQGAHRHLPNRSLPVGIGVDPTKAYLLAPWHLAPVASLPSSVRHPPQPLPRRTSLKGRDHKARGVPGQGAGEAAQKAPSIKSPLCPPPHTEGGDHHAPLTPHIPPLPPPGV